MGSTGVFGPGEPWSLLDMLTLLFGVFHSKLEILDSRIRILEVTQGRPEALDDDFYVKAIASLEELKTGCHVMDLPQSCKHIDRIIYYISKKRDPDWLRIHLTDLRDGIRAEGEDHLVITIPPDRGKLLNDENPYFWEGVTEKFPSAAPDCMSALLCYAAGQSTASVFHSMRVLEYGLGCLSESLNLPFGSDVWHVAIDQIESEVRELERRWPKGPTKSEFLKFYSEAAKEFRYFKDGWRNYVSHRLSTYDAPQALSALTHVRDFMLQISARLSEVP